MELTEAAAAAVVLLVGAWLLAVYVRRRILARGGALLVCAERADGRRWHLRLGRYTLGGLDLFSVAGLGLVPVRRVERSVDGIAPTVLPDEAGPAMLGGSVVLRCTSGGETFDVALTDADYTALRSWAEGSPPGIRHQVA